MMKFLALCVLTLALVTGCGETELINIETEPVEDASLDGTLWNLTELDGEIIELPDTQVPYLRFGAESFSGYDGCNYISGSYTLLGDALTFVDLLSTLIACPLDTMERANQFNMMLETTNRYQILGDQLHLFDEDQLLMRLLAAEQT